MTHEEFEWLKKELRWQAQLLYRLIQLEEKDLAVDRQILDEISPQLSSIKIQFSSGENTMPVGPLTISVGQAYVASVVGFDQNGAPFTGPIPAATFSDDNPAVASTDAAAGTGTGLSAGVDNITAKLTSAEGLALADTEALTVTAVAPVLTSIKVSLATPTASAQVRK